MRLLISLGLIVGLHAEVRGNMPSAYSQGQEAARSAEVSAMAARTALPSKVPGFKTASPPEVSINAQNLSHSLASSRAENPAALTLMGIAPGVNPIV